MPVDIHASQPKCSLEGNSIRLGFNYVKGIHEEHMERIVDGRQTQAFSSLADFCQRTRLPRTVTENLIMCGAMDSWGLPRRQLLWELGTLRLPENGLPLDFVPETVTLPSLTLARLC
ncbi:MAG: hypothetical protein KJ069_28995 [Anaerolineae bacterium]|nr:hypothetical protein [Anaerolineae bacterium]